ncbi:DeoR family transcriptional regulator [Alteromonas sp. ASW11-36]|uniref:DeoR family transcriptional regulator n=1 Tax=Alteromonas arenosi TaxID=3055817 RepID=A0ABT7T150_9ALTE|nr:DeoR family transcriptional regulator [Alteromonas sp. ASW11-36]MDM7862168.1 DeoR family transcriptional regulator [Alteromonas sp. ASW11-36]
MRTATQQRHQSILDLLAKHGEVQVDALSREFATSEVTIRKDLRLLEADNKLVRRFGGAVSLQPTKPQNESDKLSNRKLTIANQAAKLIKPGDRIVLDSGSTVLAMLPHLIERSDLIIMTNSLTVANQLTQSEHPPKVLCCGGTWDQQSQSFQGQMAEKMLAAYDFDLAFIGAAGLDSARGTTTFNELTNLSQVMAANSARVVIMAEANKLDRRIPNVELPWSSIDTLITDASMSSASVQQITQHGVEVVRAQPED